MKALALLISLVQISTTLQAANSLSLLPYSGKFKAELGKRLNSSGSIEQGVDNSKLQALIEEIKTEKAGHGSKDASYIRFEKGTQGKKLKEKVKGEDTQVALERALDLLKQAKESKNQEEKLALSIEALDLYSGTRSIGKTYPLKEVAKNIINILPRVRFLLSPLQRKKPQT